MPRPVNKLQITGTLTMDPKIVLIEKDNKPVKIANFPIVFDWWNGKRLAHPWYFNCAAFAYTADCVEKFLKKGSHIIITDSYIQPNKYQTKDGAWKETIKITVNDFLMVGYNRENEGQDFEKVMEEITQEEEIPI